MINVPEGAWERTNITLIYLQFPSPRLDETINLVTMTSRTVKT